MNREDSSYLRKSQKPLLSALRAYRKPSSWDSPKAYLVNGSFKMPVNFHQATKPHIPEDSTLHNHCCENCKSNIILLIHHCIM
jgi:hypothetical protein